MSGFLDFWGVAELMENKTRLILEGLYQIPKIKKKAGMNKR